MLPFGSVLMHIPLLILAFAYLVYAGAATVNKLKPCNDQDHRASAKVQNITVAESKDYMTFFLLQDTDEKPQAVVKTAVKPQLYKQVYLLTFIIPDRKAPSFFFGNDIYSRPPPFMG